MNFTTTETHSPIRIKWSKSGDTQLPYGVRDDGKGKLLFSQVIMRVSGVYECSVEAAVAEASASSNVIVTERRGIFSSFS